jgi:S-DNA-T family DNA segregation ATPase FtsK/SpoIIIE
MAAYQTRQRDPLLDQNTQAMLERRGRELLGVGLIVLALLFVALLGSYSQSDPGWMVATDEPVNNWLGRFGASAASTLFIICGVGAWGIPIILGFWGLRFVTHIGEDRALSRVVFAVIALALASAFASTHLSGPSWPHNPIGLGGLFGDTVLAAFLNISPLDTAFSMRLLSIVFGLCLLAMSLFVTGFDMAELRRFAQFLLRGSVMTYAVFLKLAGQSAAASVRVASALQEKRRNRREMAASAPTAPLLQQSGNMAPAPLRAERSVGINFAHPIAARVQAPQNEDLLVEPLGLPREKPGLLARMPQLIRRATSATEPELEYIPPSGNSEDRIKARINDVIRSRARQIPTQQNVVQAAIARREPPLNRRGPTPLIATPRSASTMQLPPQPPVLAQATGQAGRLVVTSAIRALAPDQTPYVAAQDETAPEAEYDWDKPESTDSDDYTYDYGAFEPDSEPEIIRVSSPVARTSAPDLRRIVQPASKKPMAPSRQAKAESQPRLSFEDNQSDYELPPLSLLSSADTAQRHALSEEALEENARMLESVLDDYGVKGEIIAVRPGPVVTQYELEPAPGLKASRVIGLADDIARSMSALSARVSTVPGRSVIGIELPNAWREKVVLREILAARDFGDSNMSLPLALGKDIAGEPIVANLAKMPHLLIAGTTGSGKSVAINTMILSLLYKLTPEECRLIMIDPKMLELSVYDGIPHLLSPVVTDPKKAVIALKWVVGEMEERYRKMSKMGVRNIEGFNGRVREALAKGEMFKRTIQTGFDDDTGEPVFETEEFAPVSLPYIVVVVDEMADLMMVAGKEIEACIQRLAQMARASGIHLIMATQRPSVDVITGTIKANFPTRISFQVTSKIDSRTILGEMGAEQLLGMGDMLYMAGGAKITRIHGPFVSDEEVEEIVNHLKSFGPPTYMSGVVEGVDEDKENDIDAVLGLGGGDDDSLYDQAVAIVARDRKCSTSYIQRKLGIGYNKAAKLVEQMEENHVITSANHVGKREILLPEN